MPKAHKPRSGTLQFWPRKRARRIYPKVRSYAALEEAKLNGFAGYKVGMTHVMMTDVRPHSKTKGAEIACPVTILECPPLKVLGIRAYKKTYKGLSAVADIIAKADKELERKLDVSKKAPKAKIEDVEKNIENYEDVRAIVYTQPKLTTIKKTPEIFEIQLGGKDIKEKLNYIKQLIGKEVNVEEVFREGQQLDIHAVTRGKGFQGPVKRSGVSLTSHKSEKTRRGPATLGAWHGARTWTVAHAGQMGFQTRMEHNKWLLKISGKPEEVNKKSGFKHYGVIKSPFILIKGSVGGASKRLIRLSNPIRKSKMIPETAPTITFIRK